MTRRSFDDVTFPMFFAAALILLVAFAAVVIVLALMVAALIQVLGWWSLLFLAVPFVVAMIGWGIPWAIGVMRDGEMF